jgi:uncharacterized protein (TIGR03437 family)
MRAIAVFCLAAAPLWAQPPAIRTGGVVNAASRMPSMLPGGAIGRGALFDIVGVRLGTGDQATSVTVSAAGARVRVPLLAVSPQRIAARMPAGAPLGDLSLTVTVDGAASPPYPLQVTRGNFGIFSRNREGWGPGRVDNVAPDRSRSANSLANSARPGQALVLAGTGLGDARPEVWVGSRRAFVETVRRGTAGAAADEISFRLPPGTPEGCFVPLQVLEAGFASNTVTLSIHEGGGACEPPAVLPVAAWSGRTAGVVALSRTVRSPGARVSDEGLAVFAAHDAQDPALSPVLLIPPLGACAAYTGAITSGPQPPSSAGDALMASAHTSGRDAGPRITVSRGSLRTPISRLEGAAGVYKRLLGEQGNGRPGRGGPLFLNPGGLVIAGTGGADVGPFALSIPAPEPFSWENRDTIGAVDRRAGVTLRWKPPSEPGVVLLALTGVEPSGAAWGACYCAAAGDAGSFTIPPAMLANLPASQASALSMPSLGLSWLPFANQRPLTARGLDNGLAISLYVETVEVQVR